MRENAYVLVAEDSEDDVFLFKRALGKVHFHVHFVGDGREVTHYLMGIGQYANRAMFPVPSWLILDIKMPHMSGIEVLQWLRDNPKYNVIPTIVFSSSRLPDDIQRAYELGANTFFVKPSDLADLVQLLQRIVEYWKFAEVPIPNAQLLTV